MGAATGNIKVGEARKNQVTARVCGALIGRPEATGQRICTKVNTSLQERGNVETFIQLAGW
jgi:hypothetical protein